MRTGELIKFVALRFLFVSAFAFAALALLVRPEAARIHVRWADSVDATERADLERRFTLSEGESYGQQIKPVNFLLTCPVRAFGHPSGVDPERFHLIAPYESDPERWTEIEWIDQFTGTPYRITTKGHHGAPGVARVKTYGDVFEEYEWHPETKCADANGERRIQPEELVCAP